MIGFDERVLEYTGGLDQMGFESSVVLQIRQTELVDELMYC